MVLQPSDERRRAGPTTRRVSSPSRSSARLWPILQRLGPQPTPEQILDLKICDPAMGSGAFLVAACRHPGELLVKAWHVQTRCLLPPDEDEILTPAG